MSVGERIKEERKRLGFNQTDFAALAGVQISAQTNYESSKRSPDAAYFVAIAAAGADVQYIVTGMRSDMALTPDERELLALFRSASLSGKAAAIGALQGVAAASPPNQKKVKVSAPSGNAAGRDMVVTVKKGKKA